MRNPATLFVITTVLYLLPGSFEFTTESVQLRKSKEPGQDGKAGEKPMQVKISLDDASIDVLVQNIINENYVDEEMLKNSLKEVQDEFKHRKTNGNLYLRSQGFDGDVLTASKQDESFISKSLRYLGFLLVDNKDQQPTDSPTSDDETIIEDIEKYLDNIVDGKNGTLGTVLKYIVGYVHRNVHFWLFIRDQNGYQDLALGKSSNITKSGFANWKKTVMLVHGWINSGDNRYARHMIQAYDKYGDYNIISVDWSQLSYNFYTLSRLAVNFVGPYVAQMIDFLAKHHKLRPAELHILGHSLGAHIAGIAGMFVKTGKVGRITGFDPASPLFGNNQKYRLDKSDGKFVDVIHTSILGMSEQLGHADFYPNGGGPSQPGCGIDVAVCPHSRSYLYFIASMKDNNFLSFRCDSWDSFAAGNCTTHYTHMGLHVTRRSRGKFYLRTSGDAPYALGMKTFEDTEDATPLPVRHKHKIELV